MEAVRQMTSQDQPLLSKGRRGGSSSGCNYKKYTFLNIVIGQYSRSELVLSFRLNNLNTILLGAPFRLRHSLKTFYNFNINCIPSHKLFNTSRCIFHLSNTCNCVLFNTLWYLSIFPFSEALEHIAMSPYFYLW